MKAQQLVKMAAGAGTVLALIVVTGTFIRSAHVHAEDGDSEESRGSAAGTLKTTQRHQI
jgi:hypothetical protein